MFRPGVISALEKAGIEWEMAVESESDRTIGATISADLAIHAMIEGTKPPHLEQINHGGTLPVLAVQKINMYGAHRTARRGFGSPRRFVTPILPELVRKPMENGFGKTQPKAGRLRQKPVIIELLSASFPYVASYFLDRKQINAIDWESCWDARRF
jgi:hypothetical protein